MLSCVLYEGSRFEASSFVHTARGTKSRQGGRRVSVSGHQLGLEVQIEHSKEKTSCVQGDSSMLMLRSLSTYIRTVYPPPAPPRTPSFWRYYIIQTYPARGPPVLRSLPPKNVVPGF